MQIVLIIWFQFYNSPIKTEDTNLKDTHWELFQFYNSPIKTDFQLLHSILFEKFQFYNSPIKTKQQQEKVYVVKPFQFYNSPIKTFYDATRPTAEEKGFNSTIVRLKPRTQGTLSITHSCFNSTIVRLKLLFFTC